MSSAEFVRWQAFYDLEPTGYAWEAYQMGTIAATIHNTVGAAAARIVSALIGERVRGPKVLMPADFEPPSAKKARGDDGGDLTPRQKRQLEERAKRNAGKPKPTGPRKRRK